MARQRGRMTGLGLEQVKGAWEGLWEGLWDGRGGVG